MTIIKNYITEKILTLLYVAGIISVALLAPNMVSVIGKMQHKKYRFDRKKFVRSLHYLEQKKFIKILKNGKMDIAEITKSGVAHTFRYYVDNLSIIESQKWDGLWRIVSFDIPDVKRNSREALRRKFKKLGLYKLQESIFVHPYDCQNEIELLKDVYQIKPYIRFIVAKSIDNEKKLLRYFHLAAT